MQKAHDPEHDHVRWCIEADDRGSQCTFPILTSQGSSTKRRMKCPNHRDKAKPIDDGENKPERGGGGGGKGSTTSAQSIKVGA